MNTLRIKVNGNNAEVIDGLMPASGERKFSQLKFIFDDEWNKVAMATITMFFSRDEIINQAVTVVDNTCTVSIPDELSGKTGNLYVGISGAYSENDVVEISTHLFPIRVGQGVVVADKANVELYKSILDAIADMVRRFALLSDFNTLKDEIVNARDGEETLLAKINKIVTEYQAEDTNIKELIGKKLDNKSNVITSEHITPGAVTNEKICKDAVTTNSIANNAITTEKITAGSVTTSKIANDSVSNGHLMDNSVNENKIADGAVTESKLANLSITAEKIANNAVTTDKIGLQAVTFNKIAENAVLNKHIANGSVKESKIADGAVTKAKLSDELLQLINSGGGSSGGITYEQVKTLIESKEDITNKITAFDSLLTDKDKYPTAIAVINYLKEYYYDANEVDGLIPDVKDGNDGADGVGIKSIEQTTTSTADNGINVINIVLTDDTQSTVTVRNGSKGSPGLQGEKGDTGSAGKDGKDGVGIKDITSGISPNDEGLNIITITLTDGTEYETYTKNGSKGSDGTSVKVKSVAESLDDSGENIVKFTDGSTLTIKNGSKGSQGETGASGTNGKDGYTPVKGTDYWTNEDKAEIIDEINSSLINVPEYVKTEAERVATNVQSVRTGQSFTFAGFSDAHIDYSDASKTSVIHAGMGLKCIREIANVDLVAHFGDYINGSHESTKVGSIDEYKTYHKAMYDGCNGVDSVWLQGNHDANYQGGDIFTLDEMYSYIGANNTGNHNVEYGHENQLYGFIDYPTKRLRVIYLNSSDGWKTGVTDEQVDWLSNTAFDFSGKSDKANWGIVIFIHIPVTFGDNAKILTAINNYNGEAEIIGIFHGHCHNFRTEKVTNKQIWQIGIPELCVGRNNEYAHSTDESYSSIFGEFDSEGNPVHYNKVSNTAQDTSFNIVTIDRTNKKIFCHNFGAGYDRVINYGEGTDVIVSYSVTNNLTNVSTNNTATVIQSGNAYTANLTAKDGYVLDSVTVTMGGVDVTDTTYSNEQIIISKVTGNVVITATAISTSGGEDETTYTNLFDPTADGFADLTRFSGSGETEGSCFLSNYISFAYGDVIRVRCPSGTYASGVGANQRVIRFYNSSKTLISDYYIVTTQDGCLVKDADGLGFTFTCNASNLTNGGYFRVCGNPNGNYNGFVVTVNEIIK